MDRHWLNGHRGCFASIGVLCCISVFVILGTTNFAIWEKTALWVKTTSLVAMKSLSTSTSSESFGNLENIVSLHRNICHAYDTNIQLDKPWIQHKSTVLVVLFNFPMFSIIPIIELLYRPFFPNIVYCTGDAEQYQELKKWNVTIVTYNAEGGGSHNYICVHYVHLLGLKADGFLFIADDTMVPTDIMGNLTVSLPANVNRLPVACSIAKPDHVCKSWAHFEHGANELKSLWAENKTEANDSLSNRCTHALQNMTGFQDPFIFQLADVYYIPSSLMSDASELFRIYHKHKVYLEVAVNTVLACLSWPSLPTKFIGDQEWGSDRMEWYKFLPSFISERKMYHHPAKYSPVLKGDKKYLDAFCKTLLPYFHKKPNT